MVDICQLKRAAGHLGSGLQTGRRCKAFSEVGRGLELTRLGRGLFLQTVRYKIKSFISERVFFSF
jgi:hypothetical protein